MGLFWAPPPKPIPSERGRVLLFFYISSMGRVAPRGPAGPSFATATTPWAHLGEVHPWGGRGRVVESTGCVFLRNVTLRHSYFRNLILTKKSVITTLYPLPPPPPPPHPTKYGFLTLKSYIKLFVQPCDT